MVGYEDGWKIYPDPDRELWRRLLEAASAEDVRGRQAFAEGIGLRNGTGRPVSKVCQTCTLVPLPSVSGMTTAAKPLSKALAEFDRAARADQIAEADAEIAQVVRDFRWTPGRQCPLSVTPSGRTSTRILSATAWSSEQTLCAA